MTPISFDWLKMFADILALKAKRHRNMVIAMIMSNIKFRSLRTYAIEPDVVDELLLTTEKEEGSTAASAFYSSLVKAESWGSVCFISREM